MTIRNDVSEPDLADEVRIDDFDGAMENLRSHVHRREIVRRNLAYQLLWLIGIVIIALTAATIFKQIPLEAAKDMAGIILAPLIGIFATVIGFFFGAEAR